MDAQYSNYSSRFSATEISDSGGTGASPVKSLATLLLLACLAFTAAWAQSPVIRARLEPASGIIVGQPVRLIVEVLVPNYFTGSPDFPNFELDNAVVVLPEETPENTNAQIDGVSYAGIRRTYLLYPQQPGEFQLPPAQFVVPYASAPPKSTEAHLGLPSLKFHADIPAQARGLSYFLPTTNLTMQQKWKSPLKNLRVGDTIERTITVTTAKMQGMLIPPLPIEAPDGIRVYAEQPVVQDQKTDRGEFVFGRRTQSAKYFLQKDGTYTLPAIELKWWNLGANHLMTATLPAIPLTVAPNPFAKAELPPEPEATVTVKPQPVSFWVGHRSTIRAILLFIVLGAVVSWLIHGYLSKVVSWLADKRQAHRHSENTYFKTLIRACRSGDAGKSYRSLLAWLALAEPGVTVEQFLAYSHDEELTRQMNRLTAQLYASTHSGGWSGEELAASLKRGRTIATSRIKRYKQLPTLNP
jgi:hypothetical protein